MQTVPVAGAVTVNYLLFPMSLLNQHQLERLLRLMSLSLTEPGRTRTSLVLARLLRSHCGGRYLQVK